MHQRGPSRRLPATRRDADSALREQRRATRRAGAARSAAAPQPRV